MKTVNWKNLLLNTNGYCYIDLFAKGDISLRSLRTYIPKGSVARSEVYKLEKMGPSRAKNAANKALRRAYNYEGSMLSVV